ncbi:hypothetical protein V6N11_075606 [Hibiscus sabdariffa]|uniref:AP2/ERF domain-containing protein n=1 Tax=Hibiscus sabdariffa TaxID=183260 RepID=A0ABR2R7H6_9ROSI
MRVWLGTFETTEDDAYAPDRAAYKLRGEYARLNFQKQKDPSKLGFGDGARLNALKNAMDSKIPAICQKLKREWSVTPGIGLYIAKNSNRLRRGF